MNFEEEMNKITDDVMDKNPNVAAAFNQIRNIQDLCDIKETLDKIENLVFDRLTEALTSPDDNIREFAEFLSKQKKE